MRSNSRFTTLVLLDARESYLQIRVQSLCTLRGHCRQGPRNIRYQAGATPYSDRSSTGWIAPACLAHSFDHLVGAGEQRLRGGDAWPFCAVVEPGEDTRTLSTNSRCHLRSAASLNRPIAFDGGYHSSRLGARYVRLGSEAPF